MNRFRKELGLCLLAMMLSICLSGCLLKSADELYAPPRQSAAYYDLQTEIEKAVSGTLTYCAPTDGENRQPLQMQDLDGDGSNEAIVFAKDTAGEKPLKIFVFDQNGDSYQLVSTIEGDGTSFDSISYAQMDGSPGQEIIVGRSISDQVVKSISVYNFQGNSTVELMSANYTAYTAADLDEDGRTDLFLIRFGPDTQSGAVELYRYSDGVMVRDPEQSLYDGVISIKRMVAGYTYENVPAVFVAGALDESLIVTDVFAIRDGTIQNIAASEQGGSIVRNYYVYGTDIDEDGLIELPDVQTLPDLEDPNDSTAFRLIHWYNLDLNGEKHYKLLTYHDYSYGYYLELNERWEGRVIIDRDESVEEGTAYTFYWWNGTRLPEEELFTIYILSGDHRQELAQTDGRFLLADKNDVIYAASIGDSERAAALTKESLIRSFHFIRVDWNSGEM